MFNGAVEKSFQTLIEPHYQHSPQQFTWLRSTNTPSKYLASTPSREPITWTKVVLFDIGSNQYSVTQASSTEPTRLGTQPSLALFCLPGLREQDDTKGSLSHFDCGGDCPGCCPVGLIFGGPGGRDDRCFFDRSASIVPWGDIRQSCPGKGGYGACPETVGGKSCRVSW